MNISASLIAKGATGALAASAAVGTGVAAKNDWFGLFNKGVELGEGTAEVKDLQVDSGATRDGASKDHEVPKGDAENLPSGGNEQAQQNTNIVGDDPGSNGAELASGLGTVHIQAQDSSDDGNLQGGGTTDDSIEDAEGSPEGKPANDPTGTDQRIKPTKWDKAFTDYLEKSKSSDGDIAFEVKTGKNANEVLSTAFPNFEDDGDTQKSTITVFITTSSANLTGTNSDAKKEELKNMNNGQDWTWECKIIFSKEKNVNDNLPFENKEELIGDNGFFNKLTRSGEKDLKIKFIKHCAKERSNEKFNDYTGKTSLGDEKITSEKTFELKKDNGGTKWKVSQRELKEWFTETAQKKQTKPTSST